MMKRNWLVAILTGALFVTGASAATIAGREFRQQDRIGQNFRNGELTPREAARLKNREAALHREIRRDRCSGGGLSFRERARIHAQQTALSRQIWRESHDGQRW